MPSNKRIMQFPIDARHFTIWQFTTERDGATIHLATGFLLGKETTLPEPLGTNKGLLEDLSELNEYWYGATTSTGAIDEESAITLERLHDIELQDPSSFSEWESKVKPAIDGLSGLRIQAPNVPLIPTFTSPVGAVSWSSDLSPIDDLDKYGAPFDADQWGVSFQRDGETLQMIYLSTTVDLADDAVWEPARHPNGTTFTTDGYHPIRVYPAD